MTAETGPEDLAQRWLVRTRRAWLALQVTLLVAGEAGTDWHVHPPALLILLGGLGAWDLWQARSRPPASARGVLASAVGDMGVLAGVLVLAGGAHNPLALVFLVYVALVAMVLPPRQAWVAAAASMGLQTVAVLLPRELEGFDPEPLSTAHLLGHVLASSFAAIAITWLVATLSAALRDGRRRVEATERLAAIGGLAAGVAHELGTPLATLQLLADERGPDAEMSEQVTRCREILDRLRMPDPPGPSACVADLARWTAEWCRSEPDVSVDLTGPTDVEVAGAEAHWRGALWTVLDNARRAGASRVRIRGTATRQELVWQIDDDGRGLPDGGIVPGRSGWGSSGLGLYVAASHASSVGGDLSVAPGPTVGARVTLRMPVAGS